MLKGLFDPCYRLHLVGKGLVFVVVILNNSLIHLYELQVTKLLSKDRKP